MCKISLWTLWTIMETTSFVSIWFPKKCYLSPWWRVTASLAKVHTCIPKGRKIDKTGLHGSALSLWQNAAFSSSTNLTRRKPLFFAVVEFWPQSWLTVCWHALGLMLRTVAWLDLADLMLSPNSWLRKTTFATSWSFYSCRCVSITKTIANHC